MRINNNLMAMNTHRQLGIGNNNGAKSMEKLSSGFRINRAGDDAAGLSISEKMRGQIRGLNQASRNSQDAISLIQTAEGALSETQAILQRMRELAVQSSTDTNTGTDRGEIQKEINQLTSEINRIGNTTEFNTKTLLNGDLSKEYEVSPASTTPGSTVAVTKMIDQTIQVGVEPVTWSDSASKSDFDISITGTADNGFDWANLGTGGTNTLTITKSGSDFTVDFNGTDASGTPKTLLINADAMSFDAATSTYSYNNQGISFSFTSDDAANWADTESVSIDLNKIGTDVTVGTVGTITSLDVKTPLTITDADGATDTTVAMSSITVDSTSGVIADADKLDISWDSATSKFTATLKSGATTLSATEFSLASGETLNYDQDGISFTFTATDNTNTNGTVAGSFTFETATNNVQTAPTVNTPAVKEDRSLSFQVGANAGQSMALNIEDMRATALGISSSSAAAGFNASDDVTNDTSTEYALDVTTKDNASAAITKIQSAIEKVSAERSKLGATQNRLEHTIKNLDTSSENLQASESRIRDVDMAKEMMQFSKNNILQQAAQAMLAQANQAPQGVLQLLR